LANPQAGTGRGEVGRRGAPARTGRSKGGCDAGCDLLLPTRKVVASVPGACLRRKEPIAPLLHTYCRCRTLRGHHRDRPHGELQQYARGDEDRQPDASCLTELRCLGSRFHWFRLLPMRSLVLRASCLFAPELLSPDVMHVPCQPAFLYTRPYGQGGAARRRSSTGTSPGGTQPGLRCAPRQQGAQKRCGLHVRTAGDADGRDTRWPASGTPAPRRSQAEATPLGGRQVPQVSGPASGRSYGPPRRTELVMLSPHATGRLRTSDVQDAAKRAKACIVPTVRPGRP